MGTSSKGPETSSHSIVHCNICRGPVEKKPGIGWAHQGGGKLAQTCRACHWTGSLAYQTIFCPSCHEKTLFDDHRVSAVVTKEGGDLAQ